MALLFLISDFQSDSYKIGQLKTHLYRHLDGVNIVDITHDLRLNNIIEAAFVCRQMQYIENNEDITMVRMGNNKEMIVYQHLMNLFIFPNNGLLTMVFDQVDENDVYSVKKGEELSAIEAFRNNNTGILSKSGKNLMKRYNKSPQVTSEFIRAECLYTDRHGNCFFNLSENTFREFLKGRKFRIRIQHYTGNVFDTIHNHISEVGEGIAIFRFSSSAYLQLQINMGNAKQLFRIKDDTNIFIEAI